MNIKGTVTHTLDEQTGESKKGTWIKGGFVIQTMDQYSKSIAFDVWNDKAEIPNIGEVVDVHFNAESREYNDRWFTNLTAWKIESQSGSVGPNDAAPDETIQDPIEIQDSLPF